MFFLNIKLAFRNLVKNKVYSFLIIGGFAIGFASCIMIGLYYHTETTVNKDFANHKQIYRVYDVKLNRCNLNWDLYPVLVSDYAGVENACPVDYQDVEQLPVKDELTNNTVQARYLLATTSNFFPMFSVKVTESLSGNPFDGKESIAISGKLAKSLYKTENPIGKKLNISNYFFGTVTSVFNEFPVNSSFHADVILNSENEKFRFSSTTINGKRYNPTNHFVMLREGFSPADFADQLKNSSNLNSLDVETVALQKLDDIYLSPLTIKSRHAKGNVTLLKIFLAIASLILILSSINYLNYSVSMQYARLRTTGIRKTFGADWKNLVSYTVMEVTLGISLSLLLAFFITDTILSYSENLFGKTLSVKLQDFLAVGPFFLIALVLVILLNSLAPLIILSKFSIMEFLTGFRGKINRKQIWKKALLTFQLTASTALIAVVLIIFRQLNFVKHSDPGFNRELLLKINIPYKYKQTDALKTEFGKMPFVLNSSLSAGCPGMINHKMGSNTGENSFDVNCIPVGDNYLATMGIELLEGRDFMNGDLNKTCLINEVALKQFGWENFEGQKFKGWFEGGLDVIGIIKDFKFESYHSPVEPLALLLSGTENSNVLSLRLSPGNTGEQIDKLNEIWKTISPNEPFSFTFYDDFFQSMYIKEDKLASSITFFSLIALALTCMGILGQVNMICLARIKEIGIRKINGARVSEVLVMLNRYLFMMFSIAFIIAIPVSFLIMRKWLENFAYKTSLSWWIFALAGVLVLFITLVTVSWQSWKAATGNPVKALRYE
jgi:putative ABC transport system permease protein